MRKLFIVTAILVLLAPAIGCESCLFRGAKAPAYPACEPGCTPSCAPACAPAGGCPSCVPTVGAMEAMPGPAT